MEQKGDKMTSLDSVKFLTIGTVEQLKRYIDDYEKHFHALPSVVGVSQDLLLELTPEELSNIPDGGYEMAIIWNGSLLVVNNFIELVGTYVHGETIQ